MNTALRSLNSDSNIGINDIRRFAQGWILDGQYRQLSPKTLDLRRHFLNKLIWWLESEGLDSCGTFEIRAFIGYVSSGHLSDHGRWGNPALRTPVKSRTVKDVYGALRTFFRFLVAEGYIHTSPMEGLRPPIHRPDQIQPFTEEQVRALLKASRESLQPKRDESLLLFMLDSGVRVSELCELDFQDLDIVNRKAIVRGKGNKHRAIYFSRETGRVLWRYLRERELERESPLFESRRGERLTRYGVRQLLERLGEAAKVEAVRCSPHTVRHTFAVMFLRAGGGVFTLKEMLGHTDLAMTNRYVTLAQADIQNQHRQFSPVEGLRRR